MRFFDVPLRRAALWALFMALMLGCLVPDTAQGQGKRIRTIGSDSYAQVLDMLFPRDIINSEGVERVLIVRYLPSFTAESQLTMFRKAGKWSIIKHQSESDNIYYSLNKIIERRGQKKASWLAKQVKVSKQEIMMSQERIANLHADFINQTALELNDEKQNAEADPPDTVDVIVDGTFYKIWYRGLSKLEFDLYGTNASSSTPEDDGHLMLWAKRLWRETGGRAAR